MNIDSLATRRNQYITRLWAKFTNVNNNVVIVCCNPLITGPVIRAQAP